MTRIQLSPLATDLSGKVKDTVFSSWKGRHYVKSRSVPKNPNSAAQQNVRGAYRVLSSWWGMLHFTVRGAWNLYAAGKGQSGFNMWMKAIWQSDSTPNFETMSPYNINVNMTNTFAATEGAVNGTIDCNWTSDYTSGDYFVVVMYQRSSFLTLHTFTWDAFLASSGYCLITGLASAQYYRVNLAVIHLPTQQVSMSRYGYTKA